MRQTVPRVADENTQLQLSVVCGLYSSIRQLPPGCPQCDRTLKLASFSTFSPLPSCLRTPASAFTSCASWGCVKGRDKGLLHGIALKFTLRSAQKGHRRGSAYLLPSSHSGKNGTEHLRCAQRYVKCRETYNEDDADFVWFPTAPPKTVNQCKNMYY